VSLYGKTTGENISKSDVEELLYLVKKHAPPPGSADEILPGEARRVIDWPPQSSTYPLRPTWGLPGRNMYEWFEACEARSSMQNNEGQQVAEALIGVSNTILSTVGAAAGTMGGVSGVLTKTAVHIVSLLCECSRIWMQGKGIDVTSLWKDVAKVTALASSGDLEFFGQARDELASSLANVDRMWPHVDRAVGSVIPVGGQLDPGGILGGWAASVQ